MRRTRDEKNLAGVSKDLLSGKEEDEVRELF